MIKARDINGAESEWGVLEVKMPINKININILFFKIFEFQNYILFLRNIINF